MDDLRPRDSPSGKEPSEALHTDRTLRAAVPAAPHAEHHLPVRLQAGRPAAANVIRRRFRGHQHVRAVPEALPQRLPSLPDSVLEPHALRDPKPFGALEDGGLPRCRFGSRWGHRGSSFVAVPVTGMSALRCA